MWKSWKGEWRRPCFRRGVSGRLTKKLGFHHVFGLEHFVLLVPGRRAEFEVGRWWLIGCDHSPKGTEAFSVLELGDILQVVNLQGLCLFFFFFFFHLRVEFVSISSCDCFNSTTHETKHGWFLLALSSCFTLPNALSLFLLLPISSFHSKLSKFPFKFPKTTRNPQRQFQRKMGFRVYFLLVIGSFRFKYLRIIFLYFLPF